jgi:hypothetical protein
MMLSGLKFMTSDRLVGLNQFAVSNRHRQREGCRKATLSRSARLSMDHHSPACWPASISATSASTPLGIAAEIGGIRVITEPSAVALRRQDQRHAVVNVGHQRVRIRDDDRKGPDPLAAARVLPVLPNATDANGLLSFMAIAQGCLTLCPLIAFHSKNLSTGPDAAARAVRR